MLLNVDAQIVRTQNIKISQRKRYITYSVTETYCVTKRIVQKTKTSKNVNVTKHKTQSQP
jgi:hypothetical protein